MWALLWTAARGRASRISLALLAASSPATAVQRVSLELVLAVDVSLSVNDGEYRLQMGGIAMALRDAEVIALIAGHERGVALTMTQWSGTYLSNQPLAWRLLTDAASVEATADEIERTPRSEFGNFTSIGHAINFAVNLIETNKFEGDDRKIDISGDGRNNSGPDPRVVRDVATAHGININGLAITNSEETQASYYADNVIAGPAAFVLSADGFESFGEAFKRKLKRELSPRISLRSSTPRLAEARR